MPYVFNPLSANLDYYEAQPGTIAPHKLTHSVGGTDALTPSDINAANASHTHPISDISNLQTNLDLKVDKTYPLIRLGNYESGAPQLPANSYALPSGYLHSTIELYIPQTPNLTSGGPCGSPANFSTYTITIPEEGLNSSGFKTPSNRLFIRIRNDWISRQVTGGCAYSDPLSRPVTVVSGSKTLATFSGSTPGFGNTPSPEIISTLVLTATPNGWVVEANLDDVDKKADALVESRTVTFNYTGFPGYLLGELTSGRQVYNTFNYNGSASTIQLRLPYTGTKAGDKCYFSFTPPSGVTTSTIYAPKSSMGGGPWQALYSVSGNGFVISDSFLCTGFDFFNYPVWTNLNDLQGGAKKSHTHSEYALSNHTHTLSELGAEPQCVYGISSVSGVTSRVDLNQVFGRRVYSKIVNTAFSSSGLTPPTFTAYGFVIARLPTLATGYTPGGSLITPSLTSQQLQHGDIYFLHIWGANNYIYRVQTYDTSTFSWEELIRMRNGDVVAFEFNGLTDPKKWSILRILTSNYTPKPTHNGSSFVATPPLSGEAGIAGQTYNDGTYFYAVGPDNLWKRIALNSF